MNYTDKSSNSSRISTECMNRIICSLKNKQNRESTARNYLVIWRLFNAFIIKLDKRPDNWEDRINLFVAYLINDGKQSSTIKSYISAIRTTLRIDGQILDEDKMILKSMIRSCKLINDKVKIRLPIKYNLLELILFEIQRYFASQPYLEIMYKSILLLLYYGMFRIGELTSGNDKHAVRACNVHIGQNKDKMLFILYTSKTHGLESRPQKIKISAQEQRKQRFFCPFKMSREYLALRGNYQHERDPFYIFKDQSPVKPTHVRKILKTMLIALNLQPEMYGTHSCRAGRAVEMAVAGASLLKIRTAGRWRSNAVYKYLKLP